MALDQWLQDNYITQAEQRGITPAQLADELEAQRNDFGPVVAFLRSQPIPVVAFLRSQPIPVEDKASRATSTKQTASSTAPTETA